MASMLVQQKVKDFADWKKVYDAGADLRSSSGELPDKIYRDESDPNSITIVFKWDSMANAQSYVQNPELKASMEKAGVEGPPTINFLNEV